MQTFSIAVALLGPLAPALAQEQCFKRDPAGKWTTVVCHGGCTTPDIPYPWMYVKYEDGSEAGIHTFKTKAAAQKSLTFWSNFENKTFPRFTNTQGNRFRYVGPFLRCPRANKTHKWPQATKIVQRLMRGRALLQEALQRLPNLTRFSAGQLRPSRIALYVTELMKMGRRVDEIEELLGRLDPKLNANAARIEALVRELDGMQQDVHLRKRAIAPLFQSPPTPLQNISPATSRRPARRRSGGVLRFFPMTAWADPDWGPGRYGRRAKYMLKREKRNHVEGIAVYSFSFSRTLQHEFATSRPASLTPEAIRVWDWVEDKTKARGAGPVRFLTAESVITRVTKGPLARNVCYQLLTSNTRSSASNACIYNRTNSDRARRHSEFFIGKMQEIIDVLKAEAGK